MQPNIVTAIDLGSNTLRAVSIECCTLEKKAEYEKIVRTADGLAESGRIGNEAIDRVIDAIYEASQVVDFSAPLKAVTTEALRKAKNGRAVLSAIRARTGVAFDLIDGEAEARYTLLAVKTRLDKLTFPTDCFVMIDIGGGSTEILFFKEGRIFVKSFGVGIVTIAQKYGELDRIAHALEKEMLGMKAFIEEAKREGFLPDLFVATAGTPTTVAAMRLGMDYATYDAKRVNGTKLSKEELRSELSRLLALDEKSRQLLVGVGRDDLIAAGILIFEKLYDILGFSEAVVIDDGLREGVAIAECKGLVVDQIFL